jgi:hypothetical protein
MIAGQVHFEGGVAGVLALREALDNCPEVFQSQSRHLLVARDIRNLFVVADAPQVVGVGDVLVAGVKVDETV